MPIGLNITARKSVDAVERPKHAWLGRISRIDRTVIRALDQSLAEHSISRPKDADILVGDWVWVASSGDGITSMTMTPRYSLLTRTRASGESQPLVSNIDVALLVLTAQEALRPGVIERLAATGWDSGAAPHFVVTKVDETDRESRPGILAVITESAPGVTATFTSSATGEGIAELLQLLEGEQTAAMLGHSGVGKSTLANCLVGRSVFATGPVRESDGKGRQTTTARSITPLPGTMSALIDTPGIRELGVSTQSPLEDVFVEIEEIAWSCRFVDCSHRHDAGCAVRDAVEEQLISADRYNRYLKLRRQRQHEIRQAQPATRDKSTEYARLARQHREARGR